MSVGGSAPAPTVPARSGLAGPAASFPSSPVERWYTWCVATYSVRVVPRSGRTAVEVGDDGALTIRVRAVPEGGRATDEARRALAAHLGVPAGSVRLRSGARSRTKMFEVG